MGVCMCESVWLERNLHFCTVHRIVHLRVYGAAAAGAEKNCKKLAVNERSLPMLTVLVDSQSFFFIFVNKSKQQI